MHAETTHLFNLLVLLAAPHSVWDRRSLTRDRTRAPAVKARHLHPRPAQGGRQTQRVLGGNRDASAALLVSLITGTHVSIASAPASRVNRNANQAKADEPIKQPCQCWVFSFKHLGQKRPSRDTEYGRGGAVRGSSPGLRETLVLCKMFVLFERKSEFVLT